MSRPRLFYIDAARALAITMVTVYHLWRYFGFQELWIGPLPLHKLAAFGYAGVDLFFVVSGFAMMLTWSGKAEGPARVRAFYKARIERILPPYYVAVALFATLSAIGILPFAHSTGDVVSHLAFIHTLMPGTFFSVAGVFWSLAVEMQFYLLFPIVVRLSDRGLTAAFVAATATALLLDALAPSVGPMSFVWRWNVVGFAPLFIGGMLIQRMRSSVGPSPWLSALGIASATAVIFIAPADASSLYSRLAVGAILGTSFLLFARDRAPRIGGSAVRGIGLASYSIYLYNYVFIVSPKPLVTGWIGGCAYFAAVLAVGAAAWALIERPVERLRHRRRRIARQATVHDVPVT